MIDWLKQEHGLNDHEALILCSVAMDLKISETVDAPNWLVSACMPLGIFRGVMGASGRGCRWSSGE